MWQLILASVACLLAPTWNQDAPAAPPEDPSYTRAIEKRAADVLADLHLDDPATAGRVRAAVLAQYRALHTLHNARDARIEAMKKAADAPPKDELARRVEAERAAALAGSKALNDGFLAALARDLTPAQVEAVQDRMTYHKLRVTYDGYVAMLPQLTEEQKRSVHDTLKKARDEAVYAGSAEEKTAIFDKAKGKANNYLAAQGYDLKQASKDWAERRKAAK